MFEQSLRRALMAGAAIVVLFSAPAWAQEQDCVQQLDQIEQRVSNADLPEDRRSMIMSSIESARTIADSGDQEGCDQVVAELNELMQTMEETGELEAGTTTNDQSQVVGGQPPAADEQTESEMAVGEQPKPETMSSEQQAVAMVDTNPFEAMAASDVIGADVVNEQGDTVAEITDLVKDGEATYAVLSVGGFLGIGDKEVAMKLDRFEVGEDQQIVLKGVTEDELEEMPAYDEAIYEKAS